jgi:plasmid replication initiation protein
VRYKVKNFDKKKWTRKNERKYRLCTKSLVCDRRYSLAVLKASTIQHSPKKYKNYLFMREEVDGKVVETELEENWHKNLNPDDKFYIIHI